MLTEQRYDMLFFFLNQEGESMDITIHKWYLTVKTSKGNLYEVWVNFENPGLEITQKLAPLMNKPLGFFPFSEEKETNLHDRIKRVISLIEEE